MAYVRRLIGQEDTRPYFQVRIDGPNTFYPKLGTPTNFSPQVLSEIANWTTDKTPVTATAEPANKRIVFVRVVDVRLGIVLSGRYEGSSYLSVGIDENYIPDSAENKNKATRYIEMYAYQAGSEQAFNEIKKIFEFGIKDSEKGFFMQLTLTKQISAWKRDGYDYSHHLGNYLLVLLPSEVWSQYLRYRHGNTVPKINGVPEFTTAAELLRGKQEGL